MSPNQLAYVSSPKEIYAIVRVSGVWTTDIEFDIYPGPHRLFYEGCLLNVSDSTTAVMAAK